VAVELPPVALEDEPDHAPAAAPAFAEELLELLFVLLFALLLELLLLFVLELLLPGGVVGGVVQFGGIESVMQKDERRNTLFVKSQVLMGADSLHPWTAGVIEVAKS
jgi:hypothetical protein